ncbi:protein EXECUTER 2, chloroplastic-like isoform X2 [Magnolia sinica]|uniref:protein EXECUTER 2, chloroplastic-like isoform X2 n=1 Tax=Magnolia sinica TaxID=86752 RepID=UPI002658B12D|nr:protein EXECUTER 2, chloroplastic-like isoform X2 [Magnolia sinica]
MAVANAWSAQNAPSLPLFKRSFLDFSMKKETNSNVLGSILQKPISKNGRTWTLSCRCTSSSSTSSSSSVWDWNRWSRHFSEIDQAESFSSVLKFQLEEAIENEDFQEAAKLKTAIAEAASKDSVAEVMSQLKNTIDEERYHDASRLCRLTASGLVGWWVGLSKDSNDYFGRVVRITPAVGRFVARNYSPRQLITASPGTPLFEIFLVKDADQTYIIQVVFLQPVKSSSTLSTSPLSKPTDGPPISDTENSSEKGIPMNKNVEEESKGKNAHTDDVSDEGIKDVINFLKDRIPGLKVNVQVVNIDVTEEIEGESGSLEKLIQEDGEESSSTENSKDLADNADDIQRETVSMGGGSADPREEEKNTGTKLFIGGLLHNEDIPPKAYARVPAEIKDMERDSFVLHIPGRERDPEVGEGKAAKLKVAAIAAQAVSELMPLDVAKAFWSVDKAPSKVSRDIREVVKLVSQAQRRSRLSATTIFNRITAPTNGLDPFDVCTGFHGAIWRMLRRSGHSSGRPAHQWATYKTSLTLDDHN